MSPYNRRKILMGQRELKRWHLMEFVKVGKTTLRKDREYQCVIIM